MKRLLPAAALAAFVFSLPAAAAMDGMTMDGNGDGMMSKEEFMDAHEKMFTQADKNADGQLDKTEMEAMKSKMKDKMKDMEKGEGMMHHDQGMKHDDMKGESSGAM